MAGGERIGVDNERDEIFRAAGIQQKIGVRPGRPGEALLQCRLDRASGGGSLVKGEEAFFQDTAKQRDVVLIERRVIRFCYAIDGKLSGEGVMFAFFVKVGLIFRKNNRRSLARSPSWRAFSANSVPFFSFISTKSVGGAGFRGGGDAGASPPGSGFARAGRG